MMPGTLARYFGMRFFNVIVGTFVSLFALIMMIDFIELLRRHSDVKDVSAFVVAQISFYRVPHITERIIPFTVLIGAMVCYLNLSRRLELVVARSAGVSAWQFVRPAIVIAADRRHSGDDGLQSALGDVPRAIGAAGSERSAATIAIPCSRIAGFGFASAARTANRSSTPRSAASRAPSSPA